MKFTGQKARTFKAHLWREHMETPFAPLEGSANAQRVQEVARSCGFVAVRVKGELSFEGVGLGLHVWNSIEGYPVDASVPIRNREVQEAMRFYVGGDIGQEEFKHVISGASFEEYPLEPWGVPVDPNVKYLGYIVLADKKLMTS